MFKHPCFNKDVSREYARIHLPIALDCNIQCNFCNRKYDCANENRPGVTSTVLSPEQSIRYLEEAIKRKPNISVVGIAGPGEPFARPENTIRALSLVREKFPDIILCVASNGLNILPYIDELKRLKVSHVTITVNAVDAEVSASIYSWVRFGKKVLRGIEAAVLLRNRQLESIKGLKERSFIVKINTIIIPGKNDFHILEVAKKVAYLGADILNCIPLYPSKDTPFESIKEPDALLVADIRKQAQQYMPQMYHCSRCRADAAGLLGENTDSELVSYMRECSRMASNDDEKRRNIAIATREGVLINQHLGEADKLRVYEAGKDGFKFLETRDAPKPGGGVKRWIDLAEVFYDCHAILVSGAGYSPQEVLKLKGIRIIETEGIIEDILNKISGGMDLESLNKKTGCGFGCSEGGRGCG